MIKEYKIKLIEGEKSLKQEIEVVGNDKDESISEIKDIYLKLEGFCRTKTLSKSGVLEKQVIK